MRTNAGADFQALLMGGNIAGVSGTTSSAPTATTVTDTTQAWTTNQWANKVVVMGAVYGVVVSNTATVITVDRWYSAASPQGPAGTTPGTGTYTVAASSPSAWWIGLSTNTTAPAATDTTLFGELAASGGGLVRAVCTYAHTAGTTSYTLTHTWTAASADGASNTIEKIGVFNAAYPNGVLLFETAVPSSPTLVPGDQITVTETVNI